MKLRIGFVSNSSSASFVLNKAYLTEEQINAILEFGSEDYDGNADCWHITDEVDVIDCSTFMDNGEFGEFLKKLNIGLKAIEGEIQL